MAELVHGLRDHGIDTAVLALAVYQRPGDAASYVMRIPAQQAVTTWVSLRRITPPLGYWPVIGWDRFQQAPWHEEATDDILKAAEDVDVQRLLSEPALVDACAQSYVRAFGAISQSKADAPNAGYRIPFARFAHTASGLAPIALVPCDVPWKVPAYLRFSEDSHLPQEHVAVLQHWYERWGAELVGWDSGQAELYIPHAPVDVAEACQLAVEHFNYCPDLVEQNLGTIAQLAHTLINAHIWWFWWD